MPSPGSEVSGVVDCKPHSYSMLLKSFVSSDHQMPHLPPQHHYNQNQLEDLLSRLEGERLKIDAFKRELPLCMQLLTNGMPLNPFFSLSVITRIDAVWLPQLDSYNWEVSTVTQHCNRRCWERGETLIMSPTRLGPGREQTHYVGRC